MPLEIIVIDDDDIVLFLHELFLKESFRGITISMFNSAEAAIDYLSKKELTATVYLVITDINMPRMSGWDFIEAVQQLPVYQMMHIVMATSSIDNHDREKADCYSQVVGFFEKPVSVEVCLKLKELPAIRQLL